MAFMQSPAAPREIRVFDHRPTDDELSVLLPYECVTNLTQVRRDGDRVVIEIQRMPLLGIAIWMLLVCGFGGFLLLRKYSFDEVAGAFALLPFAVVGCWLIFYAMDRRATDYNPLVTYDLAKRVLRVRESPHLIEADAVSEIISWKVSREQFKQHRAQFGGSDYDGDTPRQVMIVLRQGDNFETKLLFKDLAGSSRSFDDPAAVLAKALEVPLRRIGPQ